MSLDRRLLSPKGKAKLAIVIVNHRTPQLVTACLNSFLAELAPDSIVVIVDNASEDGSVENLRAWISANDKRGLVHLLESRNGGFAAGNNLGICSVDAQFYLLLNSDTIMRRPGTIDGLLAIAERYPRA